MYRKNTTGIIGIVVTIIILILVVIFSNINNNNLSYIESAVSTIVMPIQSGLAYLKNKIAGNTSFFTDMETLKKENEELKQKNTELEQSLRELEMIKAENAELREYSAMMDQYSEYETIPANVINKDISNYSRVLVLNAGTKHGVQENMAVISESGLVGHIISVTENTSKVQTIIDPASSVSSTISTSRDGIVCKGDLEGSNQLRATYIPTDANLLQGDRVETSGMGGIYPKGILVGTIKEIKNMQNITDRYAIVETAVDFDKLETVLIIK